MRPHVLDFLCRVFHFVDFGSFECCFFIMFGLGGLCEVDLQILDTLPNYVSCHVSEIYMLTVILITSYVDARKLTLLRELNVSKASMSNWRWLQRTRHSTWKG